MRAQSKGILLIVITGVMWGTIGMAARFTYAHSYLDPMGVNWLRCVIAAPICLVIAWRMLGGSMLHCSRRDFWIMVALGVVLNLYQYLYLESIERVGLAVATLITLCMPPVFVALISVPIYHEPLRGLLLVTLLGSVIGTAMLIVGGGAQLEGSRPVAGLVLAFGSALGVTAHIMVSRFLAGSQPPIRPLVIGFTAGAVIFAPVTLVHGMTLRGLEFEGWFWLFFLAIGPSVIGYLLFQRALRDVTATAASIVTLIEPLVAVVLGWMLFDEVLTAVALLGGVLLIGSILVLSLASRPGGRQGAIAAAEGTSS